MVIDVVEEVVVCNNNNNKPYLHDLITKYYSIAKAT